MLGVKGDGAATSSSQTLDPHVVVIYTQKLDTNVLPDFYCGGRGGRKTTFWVLDLSPESSYCAILIPEMCHPQSL